MTRDALDLDRQCQLAGLPVPVREVRFCARRWRFDFAWPAQQIAVECDGGVYIQGRHTRGAGAENDMTKLAEAACLGWRVIRVTPRMIADGRALGWIERLLKGVSTDSRLTFTRE